jgi:hypothetical protein
LNNAYIGVADPAKVAGLMKPFDSRLMRLYPVSATVGNVKNDGPEWAEEVSAGQISSPQAFTYYNLAAVKIQNR